MSENKGLSEREREILELVATGASNKEISQKLFISENTTKVHLRNIFAKLGVASRTEATLYAIREGFVEYPAAPTSPPALPLLGEGNKGGVTPRKNTGWRYAIVALTAIVFVVAGSLSFLSPQQTPTVSASPSPVTTNRWKARATMTAPRTNFAATAFENKIYALGGESDGKIIATTERYDPETDSWESLTPKPTAVADASAAVAHGRIYVPGGRLASGELSNVLEVYDPSANSWEARAALPVALSAYALTAFEGKIFLFGGWDGGRFIAKTYEYDPDQDAWRERTGMPTPRGFAGVAIAGGRIFVIGGYNGKQGLTANEQYLPDPDKGEPGAWSTRQPLPSARSAMGVASIADFVYLVGGENSASTPLQYLYQQNKWQEIESPTLQPWSHPAMVPVQTQFYVMGGQLGNAPTRQNLAYQAIYTIILPARP